MKYLVVECYPSYAVVLSDDGKFIKTANMHYEVGQTVFEIVEMREPEKKKNTKWIYSIVSVAACFLIIIAGIFGFTGKPYASVYVSINPQVRVDVDKNDTVIAVEGINEDGITLVSNYNCKDKQLDAVMDELVDMAIEQGFLYEGKTVTLSFDSKDSVWVETHKTELADHVSHHLTEKISVTVAVSEVVGEVIDEAVEDVVEEVIGEIDDNDEIDDIDDIEGIIDDTQDEIKDEIDDIEELDDEQDDIDDISDLDDDDDEDDVDDEDDGDDDDDGENDDEEDD